MELQLHGRLSQASAERHFRLSACGRALTKWRRATRPPPPQRLQESLARGLARRYARRALLRWSARRRWHWQRRHVRAFSVARALRRWLHFAALWRLRRAHKARALRAALRGWRRCPCPPPIRALGAIRRDIRQTATKTRGQL